MIKGSQTLGCGLRPRLLLAICVNCCIRIYRLLSVGIFLKSWRSSNRTRRVLDALVFVHSIYGIWRAGGRFWRISSSAGGRLLCYKTGAHVYVGQKRYVADPHVSTDRVMRDWFGHRKGSFERVSLHEFPSRYSDNLLRHWLGHRKATFGPRQLLRIWCV
jgi:hypothetical protein